MPEDTLIYDPSKHDRPMDIVCWGSGSCTTIEAILRRQEELVKQGNPLFRVAAIVTDNEGSSARRIAREREIALVYVDFFQFVRESGLDPSKKSDRKNPEMRIEYDQAVLETLHYAGEDSGFSLDLNCLAGYMLALHAPITGYFRHTMINSHPADLSVLDGNGRRRYTGDNAVLDAILAGETKTYTSIHVVRDRVDTGEILVTSGGLDVDTGKVELVDRIIADMDPDARRLWLEKNYEERKAKRSLRTFEDAHLRKLFIGKRISQEHQARQKQECDYPAYLFAIESIARGEFALRKVQDGLHAVVYRGEVMPYCGVRLEEE